MLVDVILPLFDCRVDWLKNTGISKDNIIKYNMSTNYFEDWRIVTGITANHLSFPYWNRRYRKDIFWLKFVSCW